VKDAIVANVLYGDYWCAHGFIVSHMKLATERASLNFCYFPQLVPLPPLKTAIVYHRNNLKYSSKLNTRFRW